MATTGDGVKTVERLFVRRNQALSRRIAKGGEAARRTALAEGVGFEPTIRLPVYTLSKRAPSATRPSLRRAHVMASPEPFFKPLGSPARIYSAACRNALRRRHSIKKSVSMTSPKVE